MRSALTYFKPKPRNLNRFYNARHSAQISNFCHEKNLFRLRHFLFIFNSFRLGTNADFFARYRLAFFTSAGTTAERKPGHFGFAGNVRFALGKLRQRGGERNGAAYAG